MLGRKTVIAGLWLAASAPWLGAQAASIPPLFEQAGRRALEWTRRVVELGPRPPGSPAHQQQKRLIARAVRPLVEAAGGSLHFLHFTAQTPKGPVPMSNIIARFPGTSERTVVVSGHYDTYHRDGLHFVGANDGGSSTGFLLALAELLAAEAKGKAGIAAAAPGADSPSGPKDQAVPHKRGNSVWLVFFDGEEPFVRWSATDGTYGSRKLAETWVQDGTASRIQALINVDMIGDRDLRILPESKSTPWLRQLIWKAGSRLGHGGVFPSRPLRYIADDHVPFVEAGIPAVDLIDLRYGPANRYWHTEEDTLDKLSAESFAIVMRVVVQALGELEVR